jgi:hypothetical protein
MLGSWLALALLALAIHAESPAEGSLRGLWVLAEQTYQKSGSNLARRSPELHLDVSVDLNLTEVKVWSGNDARTARSWPAVLAGETAAQIEMLEKTVDVKTGNLRTHYRIHPPDEDGLTVDILEVYALEPDGESLNGTLTVKLSRGDQPRGSYVLHRRFVREPR